MSAQNSEGNKWGSQVNKEQKKCRNFNQTRSASWKIKAYQIFPVTYISKNESYVEASKSGDEHDGHILHIFSVKICTIHNKINRMRCPAKLMLQI
jgi:hypothetical protein